MQLAQAGNLLFNVRAAQDSNAALRGLAYDSEHVAAALEDPQDILFHRAAAAGGAGAGAAIRSR